MKKILLVVLVSLVFITGCENREENEKNEYLAMKSDLLETNEYTSFDEMMCDIVVDINRLDEEQIEYSVSLTNPKEDMDDVKVMVVHNCYTEDIFPTVGLFDKPTNLYIVSSEEEEKDNDIELTGVIETTDDIDKVDLELKVLIEYTDKNGYLL